LNRHADVKLSNVNLLDDLKQPKRSKPMMTDKLSEEELAERKRRLNESLARIRHELDAPHDWEAGYLAGFVAGKEEVARQPDRLKELEAAKWALDRAAEFVGQYADGGNRATQVMEIIDTACDTLRQALTAQEPK